MTTRRFAPIAHALTVLLLLMSHAASHAAEPSIKAVDFFPSAVSADGSVVVGLSSDYNLAVRWTADGGAVPLGTLPGHVGSSALDLSSDGSVIVGNSYSFTANPFQFEAFRWTSDGGMVSLGAVATDTKPVVSADGSTVFGRGFRWTATAGMVAEPLLVTDASSDASVLVGFSQGEAFRWTDQDGAVLLGASIRQFRAYTR